MTMSTEALSGGFADAPIDAAYAFRSVMTVMARPGTIRTLDQAAPPQPLSVAAGSVLLTLCDPETGVFLAGKLDCAPVRDWITFQTGAPFVTPEQADFAFGTWSDLTPITRFKIGDPEYPDRSATLVVERDDLVGNGVQLSGPGIRETAALNLPEVTAFAQNALLYPLGVDFVFTCGSRVAALPRSTQITEV